MLLSRIITGTAIGIIFSSYSQEKTGEQLFKDKCSFCHSPNKILVGPAFQRIREDYGLDWTIRWIKDNQKVLREGDTRARYAFYLYSKTPQNVFPDLSDEDIVKILDYVDSFPFNAKAVSHRKVPLAQKKKYVEQYEARERKALWQYDAQPATEKVVIKEDSSTPEERPKRPSKKRTTTTKKIKQ